MENIAEIVFYLNTLETLNWHLRQTANLRYVV